MGRRRWRRRRRWCRILPLFRCELEYERPDHRAKLPPKWNERNIPLDQYFVVYPEMRVTFKVEFTFLRWYGGMRRRREESLPYQLSRLLDTSTKIRVIDGRSGLIIPEAFEKRLINNRIARRINEPLVDGCMTMGQSSSCDDERTTKNELKRDEPIAPRSHHSPHRTVAIWQARMIRRIRKSHPPQRRPPSSPPS